MKKFLFIAVLLLGNCVCMNAQQCKVQGIVQYFYNDTFGFKPDTGAEVWFVKYSSKHKVPTRTKWESYQDMTEKMIKYSIYRKNLNRDDAIIHSGFKLEYVDSIKMLALDLLLERAMIEEEGLIKYSTVVDGSGKFDISVPYGTYYILIKSKNRTLPTFLESKNRYYMVRTVLNSPTKIISYDFNTTRGNI